MRLAAQLAIGLLLSENAAVALTVRGAKCGEKHCAIDHYCSPYDRQCSSCASCGITGTMLPECEADCAVYFNDKRYVLLERHEGEIGRLRELVTISTVIACLSLLATIYLLARRFCRWEKIRSAFRRTYANSWTKRNGGGSGGGGGVAGGGNGNGNNNNVDRNNKMREDAETGAGKQNGLKLAMPTISASVAPCSAIESSGNGLGDSSTPNTTRTSISRRHPSEDTTLDYAYDNPAMTPSPEAVQLRTKRESSF